MTREEIEASYRVIDGVIRSPGKFNNEPIWCPYFWDAYLNGASYESCAGEGMLFDVTPADRRVFPELAKVHRVSLAIDENGFVYSDIHGDDVDDVEDCLALMHGLTPGVDYHESE